MALDGIVISELVSEFREQFTGGRVTKIAQPEKDALLLTVKGNDGNRKLFLSVNPSLPYVCITEKKYTAPLTAPTFCMSLRKHIANGRITDITQPGFERIIRFEIEHLDELSDMSKKYLIVELMGKHSNIIFTDDGGKVIDAIKHVGPATSSVRMVLPGSRYFVAGQSEKKDPTAVISEEEFNDIIRGGESVCKAIYLSFTGFSPLIANELCYRATIDSDVPGKTLVDAELHRLFIQFERLMEQVKVHDYKPVIFTTGSKPSEFSSVELTSYRKKYKVDEFENASVMLEKYYYDLNVYTRIRSKSTDMRKLLTQIVDRDNKKLLLMKKQLSDTEKMDKYKNYGELLKAYAYMIEPGAARCEVYDYNTGENVEIPLKPELSPIDNSNAYFKRYNKLKRTALALDVQKAEVEQETDYVASVLMSIDIAQTEEDLNSIKQELYESGLIRKKSSTKEKSKAQAPLHFVSSDGFDIYVGRNNIQNEEVSFKIAGNNDYWFHAKKIPGCHVIVKTTGKELPDRTFEEAAMIAGYYSSGRDEGKLEIDYVKRGELKKPPGSPRGYVIYHTNYSMVVEPVMPALLLDKSYTLG